MAVVPPEARPVLPARRVFKVISYNILAPKYSGYNSYCPPQLLAWEYRRPRVLSELSHHDADLVGLQECDQEFYGRELSGWMAERGMEGEFLPRNVGPVPGPPEGIALLWRASLLQPLARRSLAFAEMEPGLAGLPPEVAGTEPWRRLRELGEGCVMVLLRHRPTGQLLLGAVTHLFWNPAFPDVKALQAALLCGALASFAREAAGSAPSIPAAPASLAPGSAGASAAAPGSIPVVLCGDFNSTASKRLPDRFDPQVPPGGLVSGVYQLLSRGSLPPTHPDHPHTRVRAEGAGGNGGGGGAGGGGGGGERFPPLALGTSGLQLASLNVQAFGREPALTTRTASFAGCLDYVWLSAPQLAVASALAMPFDDDGAPPMGPSSPSSLCTQPGDGGNGAGGGGGCPSSGERDASWRDPFADVVFTPIPDEVYPSDHLAVGGQVVILPAAAGSAGTG